jgi:hypothetical protein
MVSAPLKPRRDSDDDDDEDLQPYDLSGAEPAAPHPGGSHLPPPKAPTQLQEAAAHLRGAAKDVHKVGTPSRSPRNQVTTHNND